jgi:hypothetical protein
MQKTEVPCTGIYSENYLNGSAVSNCKRVVQKKPKALSDFMGCLRRISIETEDLLD